MKIIVIACKYKSESDKDPYEFRLLDLNSKQVLDVPYRALLGVVANKQANVVNVECKNFKLKGSNGAFDRYSKIVNGQLVGTSKLVILHEIGSSCILNTSPSPREA